ncbi:MAG TPA: sulfurtransferase, partial [Erythrobacter sp.]|nr:sulfurtransferase [Erythrobacter sp.]
LDAGDAIQLIDVRTPEEFADGHIEGAINIPVDRFDPATLPDPQGAERILYCQSDRRSGIAAEKLAANGDTAVHMKGGIRAWEGNHLPVTRD